MVYCMKLLMERSYVSLGLGFVYFLMFVLILIVDVIYEFDWESGVYCVKFVAGVVSVLIFRWYYS